MALRPLMVRLLLVVVHCEASFQVVVHLDRAWVPDDPGRRFHRRDYGWRRVIGAESPRRFLHARQAEPGLPIASKNSNSICGGRAFVKPPTPSQFSLTRGTVSVLGLPLFPAARVLSP